MSRQTRKQELKTYESPIVKALAQRDTAAWKSTKGITTKKKTKTRAPVLQSANYCKDCGFKIRGKHHTEGLHHQRAAISTGGKKKITGSFSS